MFTSWDEPGDISSNSEEGEISPQSSEGTEKEARSTKTRTRRREMSEGPTVPLDQIKFMDPKEIKTHATFVGLLLVAQSLLKDIIRSMRTNGFWTSHPIVLGTWPGQEEPEVIDGHTRLRAALAVGIKLGPVVILEFESELAALQRSVSLQTKRRATTDAAFYRMCEKYDGLSARGGDRRSEEARSKMQRCKLDRRMSSSGANEPRKLREELSTDFTDGHRCNYLGSSNLRNLRNPWKNLLCVLVLFLSLRPPCSLRLNLRLLRRNTNGKRSGKARAAADPAHTVPSTSFRLRCVIEREYHICGGKWWGSADGSGAPDSDIPGFCKWPKMLISGHVRLGFRTQARPVCATRV